MRSVSQEGRKKRQTPAMGVRRLPSIQIQIQVQFGGKYKVRYKYRCGRKNAGNGCQEVGPDAPLDTNTNSGTNKDTNTISNSGANTENLALIQIQIQVLIQKSRPVTNTN